MADTNKARGDVDPNALRIARRIRQTPLWSYPRAAKATARIDVDGLAEACLHPMMQGFPVEWIEAAVDRVCSMIQAEIACGREPHPIAIGEAIRKWCGSPKHPRTYEQALRESGGDQSATEHRERKSLYDPPTPAKEYRPSLPEGVEVTPENVLRQILGGPKRRAS